MTTDLDRRFAGLDDVPAPDVRAEILRRAAEPEFPVERDSGQLVRRLTAAAVALLVAVGGLWFARSALDPTQPAVTPTPVPPPSPARWDDLEPGALRSMPDPPFLRQGSAVVWGGGGLFMWGGQEGDGAPHQDDGAFFDAVSRTWRDLPAGPISARSWPAAVWAGDRFVVWGGTAADWPGAGALADGAAFDPVTDTWTSLAPGPDLGHVPLTATWTGSEVVFAGGYRGQTDAVAYEPASDSWRVLPDMPLPLTDAEGVWTGDEVVVFGAFIENRPKGPATGAAYDPIADAWRMLPDSSLSPNAQRVVWDGARLVAADYYLRVQALDPTAGAWVDLPRLPTNACEGSPLSASDRGVVLVSFCGEIVEFSPGTERWHVVAGRGEPQPLPYATPYQADGAFLLLGARGSGGEPAMLAYRPGPVSELDTAWDVAAAFGALRSHYPYDADSVGEEVLAQLRPLISPSALERFDDPASTLPAVWAYYWGFEVLEVQRVDDGDWPTYVAWVRFTANRSHVERLTVGRGEDLNGDLRDAVILDAVDGELITEPGPYVVTEGETEVGVLVRGQWTTFAVEDEVDVVRCADETVDVPAPGSSATGPSGWLIVITQGNDDVDASCTGP